MKRAGWAAGLLAAALALCGVAAAPLHAQASNCDTPVLSLDQITQQASTVVIADVTDERGDPVDGYAETLEIKGALKGLPPGPAMKLDNLGHPNGDCSGGPRLASGTLYVLFLSKLQGVPPGQAAYALTDGDQSVYALSDNGTVFPADKAGGSPRLQAIAPADFARDVGTTAGTDSARIDDLIAALGLPDTVAGGSTIQPGQAAGGGPPRWLPPREVVLGIGIGALTLALIVVLVWQPHEQRLR